MIHEEDLILFLLIINKGNKGFNATLFSVI